MQGQLTVVGVKSFKGIVEGTAYDTTKLNIVTPYPSQNPNQLGSEFTVVPYGDSTNIDKFRGKAFPILIDCEFSLTTRGMEIVELQKIHDRPQARPEPVKS